MSFSGKSIRNILLAHFVASFAFSCALAEAQRPRFTDFFASGTSPQNLQTVAAPLASPQLQTPSFAGQPPLGSPPQVFQGNPVVTNPSANVGTPIIQPPNFDPFQGSNVTFPQFPGSTGAVSAPQIYPPANSQPLIGPNSGPPPVLTVPNYQPPSINNSFPGAVGQGYGNPYQPNQWPYQGTGSNWLPEIDWTWMQQSWNNFNQNFLPRLLERPRARQTWLYGDSDDPDNLNINDIEIATTLTRPNFLGSRQPLQISPGFIFHFWNGPDSSTGFDLPAQAYSADLRFDHRTDTAYEAGLETNFTVGVYSDFDHLDSDSLRFMGKLIGWSRINSYMISKIGVEYLDRVDVKLLPAFGIYATPNPDTKLDLYFPRSKLSHRIPNFNDYEGWAYIGAEYGGGSWTIERADGTDDQVDINDVRAFMGLEWMGPRRVTGFFEAGYVFERELVYKSNQDLTLDLEDTFMIRSGLAF